MNEFPTKLLLDGQWLEGVGVDKLVVTNPATEETFAEVSSATSGEIDKAVICLLYTSPSPRDVEESRMPSSA